MLAATIGQVSSSSTNTAVMGFKSGHMRQPLVWGPRNIHVPGSFWMYTRHGLQRHDKRPALASPEAFKRMVVMCQVDISTTAQSLKCVALHGIPKEKNAVA